MKAVNEALERLLLKVFCEEENVEIDPTCLLTFIYSCNRCNRSNLDAALDDQSTLELIQRYLEFQNRFGNGHLGKTGKF